MTATVTLFPGPGAGFEEPFEMLEACHQRVHRMLGLMQRLAAHLGEKGADASAQQAARDVMRYFDLAAPAHHEDEERHVLPLLRRLGQSALADRLHADHLRDDAGLGRRARRPAARGRRRLAGDRHSTPPRRAGRRWPRCTPRTSRPRSPPPIRPRRRPPTPPRAHAMGDEMSRRRGLPGLA